MTTATAPPKQAYFSTNDMEDTVCVMAMVQRIQSWQLFQAVLPQLEDDVDCTLAVLSTVSYTHLTLPTILRV